MGEFRQRLTCKLGFHDESGWHRRLYEPLLCARCGRVTRRPCDNCGRVHDPGAFMTICTVTRRGWDA